MIHLAKTYDGRLLLACNKGFSSDVSRVEYYRDLKLFMMVFEQESEETKLLPHEISDEIARIVKQSPEIIIAIKANERAPYGYVVPLVQIGL